MSDEAPETFNRTFAGREIAFKTPGLGQVLMLQRITQRSLKQADEDDRGQIMTDAIIKSLELVDKLVVHQEDRQFLEDGMLEGTIDFRDLLTVLSGKGGQEQADDEAPKVKTAAKRSPKAAPVAKPVKAKVAKASSTVANSARTKR